jgi:hypothetical protein
MKDTNIAGHLILLIAAVPVLAQSNADLFEAKIRPVLAKNCYGCHSSKLKSPMSGLVLDTKAGLRKGGSLGAAVVSGKPAESTLLKAIRYTDSGLSMPPSGKLPDAVIADFEQWIANGAVDPRPDSATDAVATPARGMTLEAGRKWWSFQPVREIQPPPTKQAWTRNKLDAFLLAGLEAKGLKFSPPADARTLIRRAYVDLTGLTPDYEEVEAFAKDTAPDAYEKLLGRLLASPRYGERWGRSWLDVASYADNSPYAWRYRDWVIEAFNHDVPYDRFVKLQLAADLMPNTKREDLRALGYQGTAPTIGKDLNLSQDVIMTFYTDDWDERVDAVTRGVLGLTVTCARCHDHKFDPITTKDYYGLVGVFASTSPGERPVFDIDPKTETRFMWVQNKLTELDVKERRLTAFPGSKPAETAVKAARLMGEIRQLQAELDELKGPHPELAAHVKAYGKNLPEVQPKNIVFPRPDPSEPFMNTVYDAALYVDGSDPDLTVLDQRPGETRDIPVLLHGNVNTPGDPAPRGFPAVLSKGDRLFQKGSGRLELGDKIFSDAAPLAARVIVNRVWGWHFGNPLVATASDFGTQGEKPSHPELLDDLAARFIANGWSMKWLHREIMLSAAYRQSSHPNAEALRVDQENQLVWRMNPRRLDIEVFRDSILRMAGTLNGEMYGVPKDLDAKDNNRRTVYGQINRQGLNGLLKLYDFPDAMQTSPGRYLTTTPLQQLFVLNSAFMQGKAATIASAAGQERDSKAAIRSLYKRVLAREPDVEEIDGALSYLNGGTLAQYAQVLLSSNEAIFWP